MKLPTLKLPTSSTVYQEADVMEVVEAVEEVATLARANAMEMAVANAMMEAVANEYIW